MTNSIDGDMENQADAKNPSCSISLFNSEIIKATEIKIPLDALSKIKSLGETHKLYYTSLFDLFGHAFYERNTLNDLHYELLFIKGKTDDKSLARHLDSFSRLVEACIRNNYKLLVNCD